MANRLFEIVTDSASDLPSEYFEKHGVECIHLGLMMNGVNYEGEDGSPLDVREFYASLRSGAMPTTYQVTAEAAKELMYPQYAGIINAADSFGCALCV